MRHLFVSASFDQKKPMPDATAGASFDKEKAPTFATLGFRKIFWRVFSQVSVHEPADLVVQWLGRTFTVVRFHVFESEGSEFQNTDRHTYIVVVTLACDDAEMDSRRAQQLRTEGGLNEQQAVNTLVEAMGVHPVGTVVTAYSHSLNFPALGVSSCPQGENIVAEAPALVAFYFYCKIIYWRVNSDHVDVPLSIQKQDFVKMTEAILTQKMRLLNVKRLFLTDNVTNTPALQRFVRSERERLKLESSFQTHMYVNNLLDSYVASTEKLIAEKDRKLVSHALQLITFLAIPLSAISAVMALSVQAHIVADEFRDQLIANATVAYVIIASFAIPVFFLAGAWAFQRLASWWRLRRR